MTRYGYEDPRSIYSECNRRMAGTRSPREILDSIKRGEKNRWIQRLRENRDSMVVMGILLALCYAKWRQQSPDNDYLIEALQYNPSGYRLWTQFLIMLDQHPIAYVAWTAIVFAVVSWCLYLGCRREDRMMMLGWLALVITFASTRQAPAFLLLAMVILLRDFKWSYLLVIPLTIAKEHAGLVYIIYLLSIKKYREAIGVSMLWAATFFSIRLLIGPLDYWVSPVYGPSPPTPFLTLEPYIVRLQEPMKWMLIVNVIVLCILFLRDRTEVFMVLVNLPIITIFGFFYEPQLWLMIMVAIIYKRRIEHDEG